LNQKTGYINLELTSDDPREFVRELIELKLGLMNAEIAREIKEVGAESEFLPQLVRIRDSFQKFLDHMDRVAAQPGKTIKKTAAATSERRVRQVVIDDTGAEPAPASSVAKTPRRKPRQVVVGRRGTVAPAAAVKKKTDTVVAAVMDEKVSSDQIHQARIIEKRAQEDGYRSPMEMLWVKRNRLKEQLERQQTTQGDQRSIMVLKKELKNIEYLLDGGLEKAKRAGKRRDLLEMEREAEAKKNAAKQKVEREEVRQEQLSSELLGLMDEIK